jgi:hypothetical protein
MPRPLRLAASAVLALCSCLPAAAAPPQVARVTPPALQAGATTLLTVEGTDLAPNPRLLLPVPLAGQTVKDGATPTRVQIEVKLADVPPGVYPLRLATDQGVSAAAGVAVDDLPSQPLGPQVAALPASLHGSLSGSATLSTTFAGKKGQRVVIEVEARRLGSAVEPVVKLFDGRRTQLAWAQGRLALSGDARLVAVLPADDTYAIELHDAQYKAGAPNAFRLRIGDFRFADLAFPLAGQRGGRAAFRLIGTVPEDTRVEADLTAAPAGLFVVLPRPPGLSGPMPHVLVSDMPEVVEGEQPPGKLQEVTPPAGINGRLRTPKAEGRFRLPVQPGTKVRFDVFAERAGSPLDAVLVLRNEGGTELARSDDQPGTLDPGLEFTVPNGVTAVVASVTDVHGRGGPEYVYRLAVTPVGQADFTLSLSEDRLPLPRGGAAVLRVRANRTGYDGPIKLTLPGLPEGVTVSGDEIPAGAGDTLLSLTAAPDAKPAQAVLPQVVGVAADPNVPLRRVALAPETPLTRAAPWLRPELAVAVTTPTSLAIAWESLDGKLPIGASAAARVKVSRTPDVKGTVRLSLLTSQVVPKVKGGNQDDVAKAVRLEGMPSLTAEQASADLKIVVPPDLPPLPYDVAVRADVLAADGKTVLATAVTPARRLPAAK